METKEKKEFMGLIEMNESQKKEVEGGSILFPSQFENPCCGLIINVEPRDPFDPFALFL